MNNLNSFGYAVVLLTTGLGMLVTTPSLVRAAGNLAEGWSVRADSGTGQDNKLAVEGGTYHFMMGGPPSNNGTF